jgi:exosortase
MQTALHNNFQARGEGDRSPATEPEAPPAAASKNNERPDIVSFILLGIAFALLAGTAWLTLVWWYWEYSKPEGYYSHGFCIPFLVAAMVWARRDALKAAPKRLYPPALALVVLSLAALVPATQNWMQAVMSATFLLTIIGSVWYLFGTAVLRVAAFPLLFLCLMAPLPGPVLNDLTLGVQGFSTYGAAKILALIGLHPVQQGNMIFLDSYRLNVDVPCSGFKLLLRLLTFSAAFAYLTDMSVARRWFLFLFSLPLSVFVNSVRIALIGVVGECLGTSAAHTFHDWSGIISLILCLGLLFGVARKMGCRTFAGQHIF